MAIVHARAFLTSNKSRIETYRKGRGHFRNSGNDDRLDGHNIEAERLLQLFPEPVPSNVASFFDETFQAMRDNLRSTNKTVH